MNIFFLQTTKIGSLLLLLVILTLSKIALAFPHQTPIVNFNDQSITPAPASFTSPEEAILGNWLYIGYIYQNQFQPHPNPNLVLTFEFFANGTNILRWYYKNETGFCERRGEYEYDGQLLKDKITWVHPGNNVECQKDPDMILGRTQVTRVNRIDNQLHLHLNLGDEPLIYILTLAN